MATYSMSAHTLSFTSNYKTLQVCDSAGTVVQTYGLDVNGAPVSVTVSGTNYVVSLAEDFTTATHKIDAPANAGLTFNGSRLGGIGIVDLRDVNKTGNFTLDYDLACSVYRMKHVGGAKPLWFEFDNSNSCYTYTEN